MVAGTKYSLTLLWVYFEIKSIQFHDLTPSRNKILNELFFRIVRGVDFHQRPQL